MYQPTTRVLTVLELLQARGRMQSAELAAILEVQPRSVRRYITMLQDLGIPVISERGRHGGYRLRPGYKLPPLMLSDDEALAVTLGLLVSRQLGMAAAAPSTDGALAKIDRVLPAAVREQVQAVQETLAFDLPPARAIPEAATVRAFSIAASRQQRLRIRYRSREGDTEREIDPYGLVYRLGTWYAAGWCHLRAAVRVFRLERVEQVTVLEERFTRPTGFDVRAQVQRAIATAPVGWVAEVLVETDAETARGWISPVTGTLEQVAGGVLLRCNGASLEQTARHLLALPWPMRVLNPPELLTALQDLRDRITACLEASPPAASFAAHAAAATR